MKLLRLLWCRYHRSLLVLAIAIIGMFSIMSFTQINKWQTANSYMQSSEFTKLYQENPHYFYRNRDSKERVQPQKEFVKEGLNFWQPDAANSSSFLNDKEIRITTNSTDFIAFSMILAFIMLFISLVSDINGHFNGFLIASKYSRKKILFGKISLLLIFPMMLVGVGELIYFISVKMAIPSKFLNYSAQNISTFNITDMFLGYVILMLLMFVTLEIIGSTFWAGVLYVCFVLSTILFIAGLGKLFDVSKMINHINDNRYMGIAIEFVVIIGLLIWLIRLFSKTSLERNGKFVLRRNMRWPLWWFTLIYTAFCILTLEANVVTFLIVISLNAVLYYLIFQPQSLKHPIKTIS